MTVTEFLLARIAEDEAEARAVGQGEWGYDVTADHRWATYGDHVEVGVGRVLAECEAKRRIVELHQSWPVLVQRPPTFEAVDSTDPSSVALRASQQMAWMTEQEYRAKFGDEPPTTPMLRALASVYADHADFDPAWRITDD